MKTFGEVWRGRFTELSELEQIRTPRCLDDNNVVDSTIDTFTDASEKAFAAAVYIRNEHNDGGVTTRLLATKSRLASLKAISRLRAEMMGARAGLKLTKQVCMALEVPMNGATCWINSINVGFWIRKQSRNYKSFCISLRSRYS